MLVLHVCCQPLVSVIVPFFNAHRWFEETLQSLERQTLEDFEVIVVDDASTEPESLSAIRGLLGRWCDKRPNRIQPMHLRLLRHSRNQGLSGTRNTGVRHGIVVLVWFAG